MAHARFLYHKERAPEGQFFGPTDPDPTEPGWVDTPQAFDPTYVRPAPVADDVSVPEEARRAGFVPQRFPSVRYRKGDPESARPVATAADAAALEAEAPGVWKDTYDPAAWDAVEDEPSAGATATSAAPPAAVVPPAAVGAPVTLTPDQIAQFQSATVAQIADQLEAVTNPAVLEALKGAEQARAGGARVTVMKALDAALRGLAVHAE